jgi:hypothetical protein
MCTRMWEKGPQVIRWCRAQGRNFSIPDQSRAGAKLRCILYQALCSNVWREQIQEAGKIRSCVMKWINGGSKEEEYLGVGRFYTWLQISNFPSKTLTRPDDFHQNSSKQKRLSNKHLASKAILIDPNQNRTDFFCRHQPRNNHGSTTQKDARKTGGKCYQPHRLTEPRKI